MSNIILGDININPLLKAQAFLKMGIEQAHSELEKAGAIQAFEICYELSWKTLKRILAYRGNEANSPREVFRLAARDALIDNVENWFEVIEKRNLTTHVYNLDVADDVFKFLPRFLNEMNLLIDKIKQL